MADITDDPDVKTTNAVYAAIAAADVICCSALGERSTDSNHAAAIKLLESADPKLSATLSRLLDLKNQAGYEEKNIATSRAEWSVKASKRLIDAAEKRLLGAA